MVSQLKLLQHHGLDEALILILVLFYPYKEQWRRQWRKMNSMMDLTVVQ